MFFSTRDPCSHVAKEPVTSNHDNTNQIDITEVVEPEVVAAGGRDWEVILPEGAITQRDSLRELTQDPPVHQLLIAGQLKLKCVSQHLVITSQSQCIPLLE